MDDDISNVFKESNVEAIIMAGWMRIVTNKLIKAFPNRILNIHPSLLPCFPGINAINQALDAKVKITGCTVHMVCEKVDSGPILIQAAVPVYEEDNLAILTSRIQHKEHIILPMGVYIAAKSWRTQ